MTAPKSQLQKVQTRSLRVQPSEADSYAFDHGDILLAEALLAGCRSPTEISEHVGLSTSAVKERLLDPVRCAWLAREIGKAVESRLGNVIGALYARAVRTGDPAAVRLLLQQYGALINPVERKRVEHLHLSVDLGQMTDEELRAFIKEHQRGLQSTGSAAGAEAAAGPGPGPVPAPPLDAEFTVAEEPPAGAGGVPDAVDRDGAPGGQA